VSGCRGDRSATGPRPVPVPPEFAREPTARERGAGRPKNLRCRPSLLGPARMPIMTARSRVADRPPVGPSGRRLAPGRNGVRVRGWQKLAPSGGRTRSSPFSAIAPFSTGQSGLRRRSQGLPGEDQSPAATYGLRQLSGAAAIDAAWSSRVISCSCPRTCEALLPPQPEPGRTPPAHS